MGLITHIFGGDTLKKAPALSLPEDILTRLTAWHQLPEPKPSSPHFLTRYVVLDVTTDGPDPARNTVQSIAALGVWKLAVGSADVVLIESLPETARQGDYQLQRALVSILEHIGKSPLVTWQAGLVGEFLHGVYASHLDLAYTPKWIDLAVILPHLFGPLDGAQDSLDAWLAYFGVQVPGRLAALPDALGMARLLQAALAKAGELGLDSPQRLLDLDKRQHWLGL